LSWLGHVHAHGLSSLSVDHEEARAIREVLGDWADRIPVTAAKSCFGHAGAGSSGLEIVASLLALREEALFPVDNCEHPDAACPISLATEPRPLAGDSFLKLSVTPRGHASALVARTAA